jgi:hypothetical protein
MWEAVVLTESVAVKAIGHRLYTPTVAILIGCDLLTVLSVVFVLYTS